MKMTDCPPQLEITFWVQVRLGEMVQTQLHPLHLTELEIDGTLWLRLNVAPLLMQAGLMTSAPPKGDEHGPL